MNEDLLRERVRATEIPNLDAIPVYSRLGVRDGVAEIELPSGHVAAHVTSYADCKMFLADVAVSRNLCNVEAGPSFLPGPTQAELLLNLDMPDHAKSRRLVTRDFSSGGVEGLRRLAQSTTRTCLDEMLAGQRPPDLFGSVLDEIPSTLICTILGIPLEERRIFRGWSRLIQLAPKHDIPAIEDAVRSSHRYLLDYVEGRRNGHPDGFITRHSAARRTQVDPLTDDEIVGVLLGILIGGDNNALSVMTKSVYALLCARSLWDDLRARPSLIPQAVDELIRLIPIGLLSTFPRIALRDIPISTGVLRQGQVVYADVFVANRDPTVYRNPLEIDFEREARPHLQFGHGIHACMGPALARLIMTTVLTELTISTPALELSADPEHIRWLSGPVLRRPDELPVSWL